MAATSKSQKTCEVVFEPELPVPDDVAFDLPPALAKRVRSHFVGLVSITVEARFVDLHGEKQKERLQRVVVVNANAATVPNMMADDLATAIFYRANTYVDGLLLKEAVQPGATVRFTCYFYKRLEDGQDQKQCTFDLLAIKESLLGIDDENDEEYEEEADDESGEEEADAEEEETTSASQRRRVAQLRSMGIPRTGPGVHVQTAGMPEPEEVGHLPRAPRGRPRSRHFAEHQEYPDAHTPSGGLLTRRPSSMGHVARGGSGVAPATEHAIVGVFEKFVDLIERREQASMARDAHFFAEVRATMKCQTEQFERFMDRADQQVVHANAMATRANERLWELSNLSGNYLENQAKANEQGWQAFQAGMQMMIQAAQQTGNEQHQIHAIQMQQLAYQHQIELERERERNARALPAQGQTSNGNAEQGGFVRKVVAPLAVAITSEALRSRGNSQAADLLSSAAADYLDDDDDDDDDDELENEETVTETIFNIPKAPKARAQPDPNSDGPPGHLVKLPKGWTLERLFDEQPIVAMLRCLRAWLTKEQRKKVVAVLGQPTWSALETAAKQPKDTKAILKLVSVRSTLEQPGVRERVEAVLSAPQAELLGDLLSKVEAAVGGSKKKDDVVDTTASSKDPS